MKSQWRLLAALGLLACLAASCTATQAVAETAAFGNTETLGRSKPPDDEVLGKAGSAKAGGLGAQGAGLVNPAFRPVVPVSTVALLTFLMAVATGLGTLPFFFFELDDGWKGACNGIACGVMLAASFDLISEGQSRGDGTCVMIGILMGGIFIVVSQRILESFGDVKMMDLSGASARRMVIIVAIMTLHSFGEGSGVGVSYAGPRGFSQGLLVTIAIAVHNVPEGMAISMVMASQGVKPSRAMLWSIFTSLPQPLVAVPAFMFAEVFSQFLPLCTGFAAGCMIWIVFGEVMPEAIKEGANGSHIATAATVSVAIMEWLSTSLQGLEQPPQWSTIAPFLLSILFILGPLLGGLLLLGLKQALPLHAALLTGIAGGAVGALALWQPLLFLAAGKVPLAHLVLAFGAGAAAYSLAATKLQVHHRKSAKEEGLLGLPTHPTLVTHPGHPTHLTHPAHPSGTEDSHLALTSGPKAKPRSRAGTPKASPLRALVSAALRPLDMGLSPGGVLTGLVTAALCLHSFAEGLMLGVAAAPKSAGLGMRMLVPAALHGLPRGVAAAAALLGSGGGTPGAALLAATLSGLAGPVGAMAALAAGLDYRGLNLWLTLACGVLFPAAASGLLPRATGLDKRRAGVGAVLGVGVVVVGFSATRAVCAYTTYCNSAPEALT